MSIDLMIFLKYIFFSICTFTTFSIDVALSFCNHYYLYQMIHEMNFYRYTFQSSRCLVVTLFTDIMVLVQHRLSWFILLQPALILNAVSAVDYSTLGVSDGWLMNRSLTEVPTNIPCTLSGNLDLRDNFITRIEVTDFACLDKIDTLDVGYNQLTYIAPGAFDPMLTLITVRLRGNYDLSTLPPDYGPNTANMMYLFIQFLDLQPIPPDSYFDQMPKLEVLAIDIDLCNDFFNGWTHLRILNTYGNLAPNFTGRTPNIEQIFINKAFPAKNIPSENVVGLTKLERFKIVGCDKLPLFKESVALSHLEVDSCHITSLPDYRHLVSLLTFEPDTSRFHCDMQSCWMRFEPISNTELATVVQNIVCHGPDKFKGLPMSDLSPVQLRCFEGSCTSIPSSNFHRWYKDHLRRLWIPFYMMSNGCGICYIDIPKSNTYTPLPQ